MRGMKQFVGRKVLVSTLDKGAVAGILWRARRDGLELRKAEEVTRSVALDGVIWIPAVQVAQVQIAKDGA